MTRDAAGEDRHIRWEDGYPHGSHRWEHREATAHPARGGPARTIFRSVCGSCGVDIEDDEALEPCEAEGVREALRCLESSAARWREAADLFRSPKLTTSPALAEDYERWSGEVLAACNTLARALFTPPEAEGVAEVLSYVELEAQEQREKEATRAYEEKLKHGYAAGLLETVASGLRTALSTPPEPGWSTGSGDDEDSLSVAQTQAQPQRPVSPRGRAVRFREPVVVLELSEYEALRKAPFSEPRKPSVAEKYRELLYEVVHKIPGETRHETARRIIRQHETPNNNREVGTGCYRSVRAPTDKEDDDE